MKAASCVPVCQVINKCSRMLKYSNETMNSNSVSWQYTEIALQSEERFQFVVVTYNRHLHIRFCYRICYDNIHGDSKLLSGFPWPMVSKQIQIK
jgi:hypothetical protein